MVGDSVAHGGALLQLHTGSNTFTRPSMGSWMLYGLGTENQNLPGFITIKPTLAHGGAKNWSSAFLPAAYQGTAIGHAGIRAKDLAEPIENLMSNVTPEIQRYELDMLQKINRRHAFAREYDPELEGRIQAFELAFRMQTEAPEAFEVEKESAATRKALRPRSRRDARFRLAVPAGAPPGRARRALHPVLRTATSGISTANSSGCTRGTRARWMCRSPDC